MKKMSFKKSIFRPAAAICGAAMMALASCEVDTTTVMFEEDHRFSQAGDTVFSMLGIISLAQEVAERNVILGEVRGDLVALNPLVTDEMLSGLADFEDLTDTTYNRYRDYYAIINNCNFYLSRADSAMERRGERVFMKEYAAVSAYRAWAYLCLARLYGTVPFYTEPLLSYSDVERVMNDPSNRKDMEGICSYFISDLQPYLDTPYPDYGDFNYAENSTIDSQNFFLPVRLLLADLYLWRGSLTGSRPDFAQAAQLYHDYLYANGPVFGSSDANQYTASTMTEEDVSYGWGNGGFTSLGSGLISVIPMAVSDYYGRVGTLSQTMMGYLQGSEYLKHLVDGTYYCYVAYTQENSEEFISRYTTLIDTEFYGTPENPWILNYISVAGEPQYGLGDLRLYQFPTTLTYDMPVGKYSTAWPHVGTYHAGTVWLRLAEAINRAGYPQTAFCVLKYGLSRGNMVAYNKDELRELMQTGYTFYDFEDNTAAVGIHALGSGNAEMDTLHYSLPPLPTEDDSIRAVEDYLIDELALQTSFDGNRFYDLMRFAFRRGEDFLASRVARRSRPELTDEELRSDPLFVRLTDRSNWYLPMVEN